MVDRSRFSFSLPFAVAPLFLAVSVLAVPALAQQQQGDPAAIAAVLGTQPATSATQQVTPPMQEMPWVTPQPGQPAPGYMYYPPQMYPVMPMPQATAPAQDTMTAAELSALLSDPESPQAKAHALAKDAQRQNAITNFARSRVVEMKPNITDTPTPPGLVMLQSVHQTHGTSYNVTDAAIEEELLNLDIRRDAQREAALSYGARGGLARRQYQVMERLRDFDATLDRVFDFRALLVRAPSGLLIEPPVVRESLDNIFISSDGNEAAVAAQVLDINRQARIVAAPRDWRHYLLPEYESDITPPPRVLWPKDDKEQAEWNGWVKQGWEAGYAQGEEAFETNLNQLVADYNGMVRYRMLLAQGKISSPFALHEDRGVTGGGNMMRVGDRALRITGPSQLLTGSEQWTPPDR